MNSIEGRGEQVQVFKRKGFPHAFFDTSASRQLTDVHIFSLYSHLQIISSLSSVIPGFSQVHHLSLHKMVAIPASPEISSRLELENIEDGETVYQASRAYINLA